MIELELLNIKIFLVKLTPKIDHESIYYQFCLETNPWTCKLKDSNREKIIGNFYEKELLLSIL